MSKFLSASDLDFIKPIHTFENSRNSHVPAVRLEAVRKAAHKFRDDILASGTVPYFRAATLVNVPYPTRYAFFSVYNESTFVSPIIHITNRLFILRFKTADGLKTLLFSPSDIMANAETRFFKRFGGGFLTKLQGDSMKGVKDAAQQLVAPIEHTVEEWLPLIGLKPEDIDYVNVHGTSTPAGDLPELKALHGVLGDHIYDVNISSTKSMTGHLLGAAGAVEALACIFAINNGVIPPTINNENLDPEIDPRLNLTLNKAQKRDVKCAMSNTFGFGGHNSTVIFRKI